MKCKATMLWILTGCLSAGMVTLSAQTQDANKQKQKNSSQQPASQQPSQPAPQSQPNGNPFPEDMKSIPVMPSGNTPDIPETAEEASSPEAAPPMDSDPVRSPEGMGNIDEGDTQGFSSSRRGLDNIVPDPATEPEEEKGKKGGSADVTPKESAEKDIEVGNYYLDNKNWRGALSRFQSAMVLAPENPDVYWGLAECYRHLGQFADARKNYEIVASYDPDSKHGKEAKKALKDPDLANAAPPKQK
jgi:tetratricopeptide (TPR) repeat protein